MDECVVDNHPQYAVKFSKMGYRRDGNITNIPLYLVGKTKELLEKVNHTVSTVTGSVVYLDKSQKHMYELNNKVRLINVVDYPITNCDEFLGFICGIVSQDHDLEEMYLDSFLTIAFIESDQDMVRAIEKLDIISEKYKVRFILSVSKNKADLPEYAQAKVTVSL